MAFPVDRIKLARVQSRMAEQGLDALLVRAPDNVVYLTNYWPMKGYAMAVFRAHGDPTLLVLEAQLENARRNAWTSDIRTFRFYDESDPRPPTARSLDAAIEVLEADGLTGKVGIELSQGSQICDRMVGEPTVFTYFYFEAIQAACRETVDAVPLLAGCRMIKTGQEIERMRLANELAAIGLEYTRQNLEPGSMTECDAAAMIEGHIHSVGVGYRGKVEMARAFALVWSGPGIATFTATKDNPIQANQPTLFELWVCADGYWTDLTKNLCPEPPTPDYDRLLDSMLSILIEAADYCRPGAELGGLDRLIRKRIEQAGYPGQPSHPVAHGVGARAHEPPFAHQAAPGVVQEGMVLAIEPGAYWTGGGGLRLEDNYLITESEAIALCPFGDDFRTHG